MIVTVGKRDAPTTHVFRFGEGVGLAIDALAGAASAIAGVVILILIFRRIRKDNEWEALDVPVIALFVTEVIQGIGHGMSLKWLIGKQQSETGPLCTAQGVFQQFGETGVALATLTIAVQTFLSVWRLKTPSRQLSACVVGVEAVFLTLMVAIGFGIHTHPPSKYYAAPVPYWCWIGDEFSGEQIGLEYLWFWITAFGSFLLYIPLFLLHFNVVEPGNRWYSPRVDVSSHQVGSHENAANGLPMHSADVLSRKDAKLWSAILYPILYFVLVLPLSVARFIHFQHPNVTPAIATLIFHDLFALSGVFNALLYRLTRANFFKGQSDESPPIAPPVHNDPSRTELGDTA